MTAARPIPQPQLYMHTKRAEWGRALATHAEDEWEMFVFEDGQHRKIGRTHLHLLTAVALPPAEHSTVLRALQALGPVAAPKAPKKAKKAPKVRKAPAAPKAAENEDGEA